MPFHIDVVFRSPPWGATLPPRGRPKGPPGGSRHRLDAAARRFVVMFSVALLLSVLAVALATRSPTHPAHPGLDPAVAGGFEGWSENPPRKMASSAKELCGFQGLDRMDCLSSGARGQVSQSYNTLAYLHILLKRPNPSNRRPHSRDTRNSVSRAGEVARHGREQPSGRRARPRLA